MSETAEALVSVGDVCLAAGDLDGAMAAYRRAVEADQGFVEALYRLGAAIYHRGDTAEALALARRALAIDGEHVGGRALLGACLLFEDTGDAVVQLSVAVNRGAGAAARRDLAYGYERLEQWTEAENELRQALLDWPGDDPLAVYFNGPSTSDLYYALSRICAESGRPDESRRYYEQGKQADPRFSSTGAYLPSAAQHEEDPHDGGVSRIRWLMAMETYEELAAAVAGGRPSGLDEVDVFEAVLALQQAGSFILAAQLGVVSDCMDGLSPVALFEFVHSSAGRALLGLAEAVHAGSARLEVAERRAAQVDLTSGQVEQAVKLASRFVRVEPQSGAPVAEVMAAALARAQRGGVCRLALANARYQIGDLDGSRQALERAIPQLELEGDVPGQLDALARLATVETVRGDTRQAASARDQLIVLADQYGERGRGGVARMNRAIALLNAGDVDAAHEQALVLARMVLADSQLRGESGRQIAPPLIALFARTAQDGREPAPADLLSALARLVTETSDPLLDLAEEHLNAGRADEAIAVLEPAAASSEASAELLTSIGRAYEMAGRLAEAKAHLGRALGLMLGAPGHADIWPVLMYLAQAAGDDHDQAVAWLSDALDVAYASPDPDREAKTLRALAEALLDVDPGRAAAIGDRLFGGISPDSAIVELARECDREWAAKRYPSRQLRRMRQLLKEQPVDGTWVKQAIIVAATEADCGDTSSAIGLACEVVGLIEAGAWGSLADERLARSVLGRAYRLRGFYGNSQTEIEREIALAELLFDARTELDARGRLAVILRHLDRPDLAVLQYHRGIRIAERLDDAEAAATARSNLVASLLAVGRRDEAISSATRAVEDCRRCDRPDLADYTLLLLAHHFADDERPPNLNEAISALPATVRSEPGTFPWLYESLFRVAYLIGTDQVPAALHTVEAVLEYCRSRGNTSIRIAAHLETARVLQSIDLDAAWNAANEATAIAVAEGAHGLLLADCRELLLDLAIAASHHDQIDRLVAELLDGWSRLRRILAEDADRVAVADKAVRHLHGAVQYYLAQDPPRAVALWDTARAPALAEAIASTSPTPVAATAVSIGLVAGEMVVTLDGPHLDRPIVTYPDLGPAQLDHLMRTFRREMQVFHGHGSQTWAKLAAPLLAGIAPHLPPDATVIAVVDSALQELPLHAVPLPDGQPLITRCAVVYTPSLAVHAGLSLREAATRHGGSLFAVGVAFPDEARAVIDRFGGGLRVGSSLSKTALRGDIEAADLLHFACHGEFDSEIPLNSGLLLSAAQPPTSEDILSVRDLEEWTLNAGLVTLSACDTALGISSPSELLGLARSFLRVGANSVLAALWKVDDAATQRFMMDFYAELFAYSADGSLNIAHALRRAQSRHAALYPAHEWAGFKLTGLPTMTWQETAR
jgi:tetratricopeptide (TPR) repeat protein